ncbi:uncharacterized protein [Acropora muricata]|uniref:uncharacterized protein n=1 Tax=Acropora muricata TaxID=159855 RepID=UPI0034E46E2B
MAGLGRERTNHYLLNRLLVEYGTLVLRRIFDSIYPPDRLQDYLSSPATQVTLDELYRQSYINFPQYRMLQQRPVSSADFDISLLAVLLRNICNLMPPYSREWRPSEIWDENIEVNISRLRDYKNRFVSHANDFLLDDATFKEYWEKTRSAIIVLGGQGYVPLINQLGNERMDLEAQNRNREFLEIQQRFEHLEEMMRASEARTGQALRELREMLRADQQ